MYANVENDQERNWWKDDDDEEAHVDHWEDHFYLSAV